MRILCVPAALPALCLALALTAPACAAPAKAAPRKAAPRPASGITVTRLAWHGWPGALRLSNGLVEAIVVPTTGRITLFQFVGHPETNPVYNNSDWDGKTVADADPTVWASFGGDKLWPAPQSEWPKHNVRGWPPDQAFDGNPENARVLPNGVRLTTPGSTAFAAHAVRTITLKPGEARLYIAQTLLKDKDAANPPLPAALPADPEAQNALLRSQRDGFPIGIWSITQTRGDATLWMPLSFRGRYPAGYTSLSAPGALELAPLFTPRNGLLRIVRDTKGTHKVGTDSGAGWIASLYSGRVLFSEHYAYRPGAPYPDGGLPAEIYTNDKPAYIEMELLGPLVPLTHGNGTSHNIYWQLQRLPRVPASRAEAETLVKAAMR